LTNKPPKSIVGAKNRKQEASAVSALLKLALSTFPKLVAT